MQIAFASAPPADAEITVCLLTREERARTAVPVPEAEFSGAANSLLLLHHERRLYVGLGDAARVRGQTVRAACGAAAKHLQAKGRRHVALALDAHARYAKEAVEGVILGAYRFDDFQAPAPGEPPRPALETATFLAPVESELATVRAAGERGRAHAEATNYARGIANRPPNLFFPETLAEAARQLAHGSGGALEVEVFDEEFLRDGGFGGLTAVGAGSIHPPRLVVFHYRGGAAGEPPLALVGKAITFDSGGLSIKPALGMEEMVWDKCGGMAVLGAMHGIAALRPRRNVVGIIASAENLTGPAAYRPGDILTAYDGKQIEINNTDAEGRVVLADAIGYARKDCGAGAIIDLATLTGACVVALGDWAAGLWSTDDLLKGTLLDASERSGDRLWPMPLYDEHREQIKSDIALIKNSSGRPGGACTAAAFLREFAGDTPWAHLDIAGPAAITKDRADLARGATGFGVRVLLELVGGSEV